MKKILNILFLLSLLIFNTSAQAKDTKFVIIDNLSLGPSEDEVRAYPEKIRKINDVKNVDFVVFSGNNINKPAKELLSALLYINYKNLKYPFYVEIGNTDCLKAKDFSKNDYLKLVNKATKKQKSFNYVIKKNGLVFVFVDGAKEIMPLQRGYYRTSTLKWLSKTLTKYEEEGKKVVIIQHFPIVDESESSMKNLYKANEYKDVLAKHHNVLAVFAGHYGEQSIQTIDGVLHVVTPPAKQDYYREVIIQDLGNNEFDIFTQVVKF